MQHFNSKNKGKALVVGGSLSGLMTAIALAEEDIEVILLEKTAEGSREGAGLQVDGSRFYQSKTEKKITSTCFWREGYCGVMVIH